MESRVVATAARWPRQVERAYRLLVGSALDLPRVGTPSRRASLCHDGTSIVYSHELRRDAGARTLRVLVEPGGMCISVSEQIDWSLNTLDRLLGVLGYRGAAADVNTVVAATLPADPEAVRTWWGGIWLGLVAGAGECEARAYLNLRDGPAEQRWQRIARVLSLFGDERLGPPLQRLADGVHPYAVPVGLGLAIVRGRVPVLRLYAGVREPNLPGLAALIAAGSGENEASLAELYGMFEGLHGSLPQQSVTVGYDFLRGEHGRIEPSVARTKLDFSCQQVEPAARHQVLAFAGRFARRWGLAPDGLRGFTADLVTCFGGFDLEYLSASFADGLTGLTFYAKPHGYPQV